MKHNIIAALAALPIITATPSYAATILSCHWQGATFLVDRSGSSYQIKFNDAPWLDAVPKADGGDFVIGIKTDGGAYLVIAYNPTTKEGVYVLKATTGEPRSGAAYCNQ